MRYIWRRRQLALKTTAAAVYELPQRDGASGAQDLRDAQLAHKMINMMFKVLSAQAYEMIW